MAISNTLTDIWTNQPSFLDNKSFRQVIQMAGDGRLVDGSAASVELREWLTVIPLDRLRSSIDECLSGPFDEHARALQDAANEIGNRLGFKVAYGRYRGSKREVGHDGLWTANDDFQFLVEVKTTDAYRINLDTIAGYRAKLVSAGELKSEHSSILIIVGRNDTGELEAQIRGSKHAWDMRLISLDALLRLADVKEEIDDSSTSDKIDRVLRPMEYTRLDGIVDLLFATTQDIETSQKIEPPAELARSETSAAVGRGNLETARDAAVMRIGSKLGCSFIKRGRATREASDGRCRLVCLASQPYEGPAGSRNYWYGFTPSHRDFLDKVETSYLALICVDSSRVFLVPWKAASDWLPDLWTTPPDAASPGEVRHWHLYFNDFGNRVELMRLRGGVLGDISKYLLQ